jgi:hypothetical protein
MLKITNDYLINRAIQCLYPLELRENQPEDITVEERPESETESDPSPPDPTSKETYEEPVVGEVEPNSMGSVGEYIGNLLIPQQPTTRVGRRICSLVTLKTIVFVAVYPLYCMSVISPKEIVIHSE